MTTMLVCRKWIAGVLLTFIVLEAVAAFRHRDEQKATTAAIEVAREWKRIAMDWKANSDKFEEISLRFQSIAEQNAQTAYQAIDNFQVCNSMLPRDQQR